jgi:3'-phosphoadenosine 5'-phosphosulfate sulfotransferase (PAPS reductase)/FAD synthetase
VEYAVLHNEELLKSPPLFHWVYRVLSRVAEKGVKVVITVPRDDYLSVIFEKRYSPPGYAFMWCTARLKERPTAKLAKMLALQKYVLLIGVRMVESLRRATYIKTRCKLGDVCGEMYFIQKMTDHVVHLAPIVDWSDLEVISYLKIHRQPWSGEDYSYLLERVYCNETKIRTGCTLCTVIEQDVMLETYAKCHGDSRYLKLAEIKRKLRAIGFDWELRMYKSKKLNENGLKLVKELLIEIFDSFPELLAGYATFKPEVVEKHLPEVAHHLPSLRVPLPQNIEVIQL